MQSILFAALLLCNATPQAPRPPQAPPVKEVAGLFDYNRAWNKAAADKKPLVAFVRQASFPVAGAEVATTDLLFLTLGTGVVIAIPDGKGGLVIHAEIKGSPTLAEIQQSIAAAVQPKVFYEPAPVYAPAPVFAPPANCSSGH